MLVLLNFLADHFDFPILEWIAANLWCPFWDAVMPVITMFGDAGIFWIALAVLFLIFPKYRKMGLSMGLALLMGLLICNVLMKPLIARPRPYDYFGKSIELLVATPHDFSFPSGHTLASFEAATAILIRNRKLGVPAMILACLIAFSRLYLYVHYPTDVLFSMGMGIGFAFLATFLVNKGWAKWENRIKKSEC